MVKDFPGSSGATQTENWDIADVWNENNSYHMKVQSDAVPVKWGYLIKSYLLRSYHCFNTAKRFHLEFVWLIFIYCICNIKYLNQAVVNSGCSVEIFASCMNIGIKPHFHHLGKEKKNINTELSKGLVIIKKGKHNFRNFGWTQPDQESLFGGIIWWDWSNKLQSRSDSDPWAEPPVSPPAYETWEENMSRLQTWTTKSQYLHNAADVFDSFLLANQNSNLLGVTTLRNTSPPASVQTMIYAQAQSIMWWEIWSYSCFSQTL